MNYSQNAMSEVIRKLFPLKHGFSVDYEVIMSGPTPLFQAPGKQRLSGKVSLSIKAVDEQIWLRYECLH
jgi:hypothetical protein